MMWWPIDVFTVSEYRMKGSEKCYQQNCKLGKWKQFLGTVHIMHRETCDWHYRKRGVFARIFSTTCSEKWSKIQMQHIYFCNERKAMEKFSTFPRLTIRCSLVSYQERTFFGWGRSYPSAGDRFSLFKLWDEPVN